MPLHSPVHVNNELLCAIGTRVNNKDLLQVTVMPLDSDWQPSQTFDWFDIRIKPQRFDFNATKKTEGAGLPNEDIYQFIRYGIDYDTSGDIFIDWFKNLGLKERKKLVPVAYRWHRIKPYLVDWLGELNFDYCFSPFTRDLHTVKNFLNDVYDYRGDRIIFPNDGLTAMSRRLHVEEGPPRSAIDRARQTAACYRAAVRLMLR